MRTTLKKLFFLDMLYGFIASALAVLVPLYMLEINLNIAEIGILISLIPLVFMLMRLLFASISDQTGTKTVEVLESVATIAAIAIYILSRSARGFAMAQFGEGVRDAGFWATARADIVNLNGKKNLAEIFALFVGLRQLADAIGRLSVGVLLLFLTFQQSFELLFVLSLLMLVLVLTINKNPFTGFPSPRTLLKQITRKRPHIFWQHAWSIALQMAVPSALIYFFLPLYFFSGLGLGYFDTALWIAILSLALAIANILAIKLHMSPTAKLFVVFMMVPAYLLLPFFGHNPLFPLILIGMGAGCGNVLSEKLVSRDVRRSRNIATEVSIIYLPYMLALFLMVFLGGLAVEMFGYIAVFNFFALVTFCYVLYAAYAFRLPIKKAIKGLPVIGGYAV
jgi:MFS family permease